MTIIFFFHKKKKQNKIDNDDGREKYFLETISQFVDKVDLKFVLIANKIDSKTSIDDLVQFALKGLSHNCHRVRVACATIMKKLTPGLLERDVEAMNKRGDSTNSPSKKERWHLLEKFNQHLLKHAEWSRPLIEEFKLVHWMDSIIVRSFFIHIFAYHSQL